MNKKLILELMKKEGVVEVKEGIKIRDGVDTGEKAIIVGVIEKKPRDELNDEDVVPACVGKLPTDVVEVGEIFALNVRTERHRPAPGGVSIGHKAVSAGTFGCVVRRDEEKMMLSNHHVFVGATGRIGDELLQPGKHDGGTIHDEIGKLEDFEPIEFELAPGDCWFSLVVAKVLNKVWEVFRRHHSFEVVKEGKINLVDAAIGKPSSSVIVKDTILDIGEVYDEVEAYKGMHVLFSGRTSGLWRGIVTDTGVAVKVNMGDGQNAIFGDQIEIKPGPQGGDSGSLLVSINVFIERPIAVGLVFAGNNMIGFANRFANVKKALSISLA